MQLQFCCVLINLISCYFTTIVCKMSIDDKSVENFRSFLRIRTVQPNPDYKSSTEFLQNQAKELDLPVQVVSPVQGKPIVVITWQGQEPKLPAIMLNCHVDVVPVYEHLWTHKPFAADMDDKGNIYARGAQDMKCVGIWYLEAIRRLRSDGIKLKRTLHLTYVPDEEIGGTDGMKAFVQTDFFKKLNIGFALDEGMPEDQDQFLLFYGEKANWEFKITCHGQTGHGSAFFPDTAGQKISYIINKMMEQREINMNKLNDNSDLTPGDVTSINLTILSGGVQNNVVPENLSVTFDCRVTPSDDIKVFQKTIETWCKEAGSNVDIHYILQSSQDPPTKIDDTNPFWIAFKAATDQLNLKLNPVICPASTDMRFIRHLGIPALGFSPMNLTPTLVHDNDEYLNKDIFIKGIYIYKAILASIANS